MPSKTVVKQPKKLSGKTPIKPTKPESTNPLPKIVYDLEQRIKALEKHLHKPVDFTPLKDLEARLKKVEVYIETLEQRAGPILNDLEARQKINHVFDEDVYVVKPWWKFW